MMVSVSNRRCLSHFNKSHSEVFQYSVHDMSLTLAHEGNVRRVSSCGVQSCDWCSYVVADYRLKS
jgi:hypothetical protein